MKDTAIGWCHDTVNLWWGCAKVSPACLHCYAEFLANLFSRGRATWGTGGLRWNRAERALAELDGLQRIAAMISPRRVFMNSMSDTFEDRPDLDAPRQAFFSFVDRWPDLRLLLLTKRPENILRMVPAAWLKSWPTHVWVGTTVESQEYAEQRIPALLEVPARVRFLSCEPLLGPLDIMRWLRPDPCVDYYDAALSECLQWVIAGGESGPGHRALDLDDVASLAYQCRAANVPFFLKQDSGPKPGKQGRILDELWVQDLPSAA